jgi:hypothetical protein
MLHIASAEGWTEGAMLPKDKLALDLGAADRASIEHHAAPGPGAGEACRQRGAPAEHVDHVTPVRAGGSDWLDNLRAGLRHLQPQQGRALRRRPARV